MSSRFAWALLTLGCVWGCEPGVGSGGGGGQASGDAANSGDADGTPSGGGAHAPLDGASGAGQPEDGGTPDGEGAEDAPGASDATPSGDDADGGGSQGSDAAAQGDGDGGDGSACVIPPGTPTWNQDVGEIIVGRCGLCHAAPPVFGAPLPFMSYAQVTASTREAGTPIFERIAARIEDGSMPPPAQPPLTPAEKAVVAAWAAGCAPEGEGSFVPPAPGSGGGMPVGPPPADAQIVEVRANDYAVPLKSDQYMCFPVTLKLDGPKHIVRFGIELDEAAVIHHIVLYQDPKKLSPHVPFSCGGTPNQAMFMYGWAPGGSDLQFPSSFGYPAQDGDVIILQVHYNNSAKLEGLLDDSAVLLYLTEPQPNAVGMMATGKLGFSIPPFAETVVQSQCRPSHDITIFASMPHMHQIGKTFDHVVERKDGTVDLIVHVDNWSFADQPFYWTPITVGKADRMLTTCTYQNPTAKTVSFGDSTTDEMCFNFFYHFPPTGASFCDELLDEDTMISYEPGACAGENAPLDPPQATGGVKLESELGVAYGGVGPYGSWQLEELHLVLASVTTPVGDVDVESTKFYAKGYLDVQGDHIVADIAFAGELVLESGISAPYETAASLSGTWALKENGTVAIDYDCKTELPFESLRFGEVEGGIGALFDITIGGAFTLSFETLWGPLEL